MQILIAKILLKILNWSISGEELTKSELKEVRELKAELLSIIPYSKKI